MHEQQRMYERRMQAKLDRLSTNRERFFCLPSSVDDALAMQPASQF